ncbi:IclR family transcriptional regulator C-terminal domain-containing protein [Polaromonas sp. OV174]|uniref:IclR family transcriptional regulator domain-containing protein n=1 Tax=Polaromonas sp. OV174 TaxID=1855300 RepID=UPI0035175AAD
MGERESDIAALAALVFGPDDAVVGSISISGPSSRFAESVPPSHSADRSTKTLAQTKTSR